MSPARPGEILIVEDDRFQRRAVTAILQRHGFTVRAAVDGEEGVRLAGQGRPPDLVLLNLILPKLSGFDVLRRLKADPATAAVPVIVISNLGQQRDVRQALGGGAVGYLVKADITLQELVRHVEEALAGVAA